jgi:CRISPR-associated endonuclease Cas2
MKTSLSKVNVQNSLQRSTVNHIPSDESLAKFCSLLMKQARKEKLHDKYAPVKNVLSLLGAGAAISVAILAPKSATLIRPLLEGSPNWNAWKHFNTSYLQRTLKRLQKQKSIEIVEKNGQQIISLTNNGKRKILKYNIDTLAVDKPKHWDGKWRLVLYDVPSHEKNLADSIRATLHNMGFYAIQESVYVYPYSCFDQVEYLRQYYNLGTNVQYMVVVEIENNSVYKTYFNL